MDWSERKRPGRAEIVALAAILLIAGVLRMAWPGLVEFKRDEALLLARALDMAEFRQFHVRGISSSVGFPNFPMSVWLYALPLLVWPHVYAATLFTGLLNTAAVLGCWWLARRYWGPPAGLAAALMFAVSPWAVFHSQKIWAQNLLPPLVMAWAISAALGFVEGRSRYVMLHVLILAVAIQVHFAAAALLPATFIFLVAFRTRIHWRSVAAGGLLGFLTALPFLTYLVRSGAGLPTALEATGQAGTFTLEAWRWTWLLSTGREIHALAGPEVFESYLASVPDLTLVQLFWGLLAVAGLFLLGRRAWRLRGRDDSQADMGLVTLIWFLVPPLFYSLPLLPVKLHYLLLTYPVQYLAAGVALGSLTTRLRHGWPGKHARPGSARSWPWVGWAALCLSAAGQIWIWLALLGFVAGQATPGGYGTPVRYHLHAADVARNWLSEIAGDEILVAGQSERSDQDEFAAVYNLLLRDVPHRFVDLDRSALFPAGPAVALLHPQASGPAPDAYLRAAARVTDVPLRDGEGALQVAALPAAAAPTPWASLAPTYLFANWVELIGYDPPEQQPGGRAWWRIYWRTGANPDPADYHFFNHLIDGSGQRIAQQDAAAFSPWQWRAGDTVLSVFALAWPAETEEPLSMRVGQYAYPELRNVPLLDVAGNPIGESVDLPLP